MHFLFSQNAKVHIYIKSVLIDFKIVLMQMMQIFLIFVAFKLSSINAFFHLT